MKAALTTRRNLFKGTQAMMVGRPSSLAPICFQGMVCSGIRSGKRLAACLIDVLEVQHVN